LTIATEDGMALTNIQTNIFRDEKKNNVDLECNPCRFGMQKWKYKNSIHPLQSIVADV